ncbi:MAG: hypothetical protein WCX64_04785 [Candidatus Micrarchaeia archaeon]
MKIEISSCTYAEVLRLIAKLEKAGFDTEKACVFVGGTISDANVLLTGL